MSHEDIDPADHHTREMYARYGLAMYFAQAVEAGLKSALVMAQLSSAEFSTIDEYDDSWALNFKATMGKLLRRLAPFLGDDDALSDDLQLALMTRNQFAHHFFWDHAADATSFEGRDRMITECMAAVEFFQDIEERLRKVVQRYSEKSGTAPEVFAHRMEESMEDLLSNSAGTGSKNCGRCLTSMEIAGTERQPYWKCSSCGAIALA